MAKLISSRSYIQEALFEYGMGHVVVVREKSGGRLEAGFFLVDIYCRGVCDAFFETLNQSELEQSLRRLWRDEPVPDPDPGARGRKLVEDAVAYAASLGLSPSRDYKKGARVFGGIDASECREEFTFGKDGKPFLIARPHESPAQTERLLALLRARCGEDGFDFLIPVEEEEILEEMDFEEYEPWASESRETPDGKPSSELLEFIDEVWPEEALDVSRESGPGNIASEVLNLATQLSEQQAGPESGFKDLETALDYLQWHWNYSLMTPGAKALALEEIGSPEIQKLYAKEEPRIFEEVQVKLAEEGVLFFIEAWRLVRSDSPDSPPNLLLLNRDLSEIGTLDAVATRD